MRRLRLEPHAAQPQLESVRPLRHAAAAPPGPPLWFDVGWAAARSAAWSSAPTSSCSASSRSRSASTSRRRSAGAQPGPDARLLPLLRLDQPRLLRSCCCSRPRSTGTRAWSRAPAAGGPGARSARSRPAAARTAQRAALVALDRLQPLAARLLQVLRLRGRRAGTPPCGARPRRRRRSTTTLRGDAAARHQLLHLPVDELHDRRLPRPRRARCAASSTSPASSRCSRSSSPVRSSASRRSPISSRPRATRSRSSRAASPSSRLGLAKKVLLANPCGKIADTVLRRRAPARARRLVRARSPTPSRSTSTSRGYSDMAIGLGLMLGFVFPKNFDSPYRAARSPSSGGAGTSRSRPGCATTSTSRSAATGKGPRRTYVNLALVMLLGGLWHGAAWNFVLWGGLHGAAARVRARARSAGAALAPAARARCAPRSTFVARAPHLGAASAPPTSPPRGDYLARHVRPRPRRRRRPRSSRGLIYEPLLPLLLRDRGAASSGPRPRAGPGRAGSTLAAVRWPLGGLLVAAVALATQEFNPFIYFIF